LIITNDGGGEHITLTVTNAWEDITDRLVSVIKQLKEMQLSSTVVEEWTAEGSDQSKVGQKSQENLWEMQRKYDESNDLQTEEIETYYVRTCGVVDNFGPIGGASTVVAHDLMNMQMRNDSVAAENLVWVESRVVRFSRNPRFTCRIGLISDFTANGDYILFGMRDATDGAVPSETEFFGFQVYYDGVSYMLRAVFIDGAAVTYYHNLLYLASPDDPPTLYDVEAKVEWANELIFYYVNGVARAIIPIVNTGDAELRPMYVRFRDQGSVGGVSAEVEWYIWKSQALKENIEED